MTTLSLSANSLVIDEHIRCKASKLLAVEIIGVKKLTGGANNGVYEIGRAHV